MSEEEEEQKKKKKKKRQQTVLETEKVESELLPELVEALDALEKEKKYLDIQVCPRCKSPLVKRDWFHARGYVGSYGIYSA